MPTAPGEGSKAVAPRSRKGALTRARLLDAAKQIFEEDGYFDARISDIAERAGLSHGSFYHYFDSKEQAFREVAEGLDSEMSAPLGDVILARSSHAPEDRIREGIRLHFQSFQREARIMGVIEQVARYDDHINAVRLERHGRDTERIAESIRQLQRRELADPTLDASLAAAALGALTYRFAEMWFVQGSVDCELDEGVEQIARIFVNALGIKRRGPDAATA